MNKYEEQIHQVFGNKKAEWLLEEWQKMYGDRMSYFADLTPEEVAFREGERSFYLTIKGIIENGSRES
jgi:hypothetical protein